jgi:hypothetical protein
MAMGMGLRTPLGRGARAGNHAPTGGAATLLDGPVASGYDVPMSGTRKFG